MVKFAWYRTYSISILFLLILYFFIVISKIGNTVTVLYKICISKLSYRSGPELNISVLCVLVCFDVYLLRCVLLLLHPGTLGDDELVAALVDDTRANWNTAPTSQSSLKLVKYIIVCICWPICEVISEVSPRLNRPWRIKVKMFCRDSDAALLHLL